MDKQTQEKIWKAVEKAKTDETYAKSLGCSKLWNTDTVGDESRYQFSGRYRERYNLIKSLNLCHRPTKEETDEAIFYAVFKTLEEQGEARRDVKE